MYTKKPITNIKCVGKGVGQRGNATAGGSRIGEGCVGWKQPSQGHFSIFLNVKMLIYLLVDILSQWNIHF